MRTARLVRLALAASCGVLASSAALALTLDEYVVGVGEVSVAAIACDRQIDKDRMLALAKQFEQREDPKRLEELSARIAAAFQAADKRREAMTTPRFCAEMNADWGPAGRKSKGLLK